MGKEEPPRKKKKCDNWVKPRVPKYKRKSKWSRAPLFFRMLRAVLEVREHDRAASIVAAEYDIPARSLRRYVGESINEPRSEFFYKDAEDIRWRLDGFQTLAPPSPPPVTIKELPAVEKALPPFKKKAPPPLEEIDDNHQKLMLETMVDMIGRTDRDGMVWVPLWYVEFMMNK